CAVARAAARPRARLAALGAELAAAAIDLPTIVAATRGDEAPPRAVAALRRAAATAGLPVHEVSVLDDASLDALREGIWGLTGLVRIHLRREGVTDPHPLALPPPVTL